MFCILVSMQAQKINASFQDANMPEVLKYINKNAKDCHVSFIYDDLDGLKVTHNFVNETPLEAVRHAIGAYPIKVTEEDGDIYVEYDKDIVRDIVLDNVMVYGTPEAVKVMNYMRKMMRFSVTCPQEKVYLHFDNTGYFMGENIWFKAYIVNTAKGTRTDLSQTLYVELINPEGEVIQTKKLYIKDGEAEGSFELESMYCTGFYEIRAYTRYMLNWGAATAFSRVLPVFKAPKNEGDYSRLIIDQFTHTKRHPSYREMSEELINHRIEDKKNENANLLKLKRLPKGEVNVHFYPEGGNLVEDLPTKVAFTITDSEGRHFDCDGVLVDEKGNILKGTITLYEGRGWVEVKPSASPTYLQVKTADGKIRKFALPEIEYEGISMTMNTMLDETVTASIRFSPSMRGHILGYTLMHDGKILTCDTITCSKDIKLTFNRDELPGGVNQLTVFDSNGRIHADRLFFIYPKNYRDNAIKISTSTSVPVPCGKIKLDINAKPNSSISLSAMDIATLPNGKQSNALTWMLLSSDLKGYIDNPEYYFECDDREHRAKADLLMMVQGWRRYDWNLMSGESDFARIYPIEDKLYLDGKLTQKKGKHSKLNNVRLDATLYNRLGESASGTTITDSVGNFAFEVPNSSGEWTLIFKTTDDEEANICNICLDRNFSPQPRYLSPYETESLPPLKPNLFEDVPDSVYDNMEMPKFSKRELVLPEVKVQANRRIFDNARAAWESEEQAQAYATIYYNIDKEIEKIEDRGDEIPPFKEWLYARNPLFTATGADRFIQASEKSNIVSKNSIEYNEMIEEAKRAEKQIRFWNPEAQFNKSSWTFKKGDDGKLDYNNLVYSSSTKKDLMYGTLEYKHRPICWILNNVFYGVSSEMPLDLSDMTILKNSLPMQFPVFLDEVNAVYISETASAFGNYVSSPTLSSVNCTTIFVYTHRYNYKLDKGTRRTYFQSYNDPETFQMDNYSILPPMEDFRRTIFWAPNVRTDNEGKANVEFYNNSSCRKMYISAEGLDKEGNFIVH